MLNPELTLLIVDDEPNILKGLASGLKSDELEILTATNAKDAMDIASSTDIHIVITDLRLAGNQSGMDILRSVKELNPETSVMMITAFATVETAVNAMRLGAFDFITKPLDLDIIRHQVKKAVQHQQLIQENRKLRLQLSDAGSIAGILGQSEEIQKIIKQIKQIASTDATVIILGESGTGKEVTARAIHKLSSRKNQPFVPINMGALPESLVESELFGHEKGAFTDARRQKAGYFENAHGGTVFLDEITETSGKTQISLLRVLEEREFMRVGGDHYIPFDARIISATNKNIESLISKGEFREDLFYRLNIIPVFLPPLRNRQEDIPILANHFINHFCSKYSRPTKELSKDAIDHLCQCYWPGNIRQLRNLMERIAVTVHETTVKSIHIPTIQSYSLLTTSAEEKTLNEIVESAEKEAITQALHHCHNHREKTAEKLKISIRSLHYKMSKYGIQ